MSEETVPAMRERIQGLEKELKSAQDAAAAAESKARLYEAKDTFREAGYNPVHAQLFVSANPEGEITQDSVVEFADQYNLAPVEQEGESGGTDGSESNEGSEGSSSDDSGLSAMGRAGGRAGSGGQQSAGDEKMTHQEWMELNKRDRVAARQALEKGLVES